MKSTLLGLIQLVAWILRLRDFTPCFSSFQIGFQTFLLCAFMVFWARRNAASAFSTFCAFAADNTPPC